VGLGLVALGAWPVVSSGVVLYDSLGFEPPRFVPGELTGQDPLAGPWEKSGTNTSTALVQALTVQSGAQSVQVTRQPAPNGDSRWTVFKEVPNPLSVTVDWHMRVQQSTTTGFGPYVGVEVYDELGNDPLLAGSLGVDSRTGDVLFQEAGTGFLLETGTVVPFDQWNQFRIVLDYANDRYSVFMNGAPLGSQGFVDAGIDDFTDADIATLAAAGDPASLAAGGTAFFDNYRVEYEIPEPSSVAILLIPFAMLGRATARRGRA
jgi:hypothetical protein